jgi:hypothetical protein
MLLSSEFEEEETSDKD